MSHENRYIQFPLFLIKGIFKDTKRTLNDILAYGIYHFGQRIELDPNEEYDVATQIVYAYYKKLLPDELFDALCAIEWEYFGLDEDYNGFDHNGTFDPFEEANELEQAFKKNESLRLLCIEFYLTHIAMRRLKIKGTVSKNVCTGRKIEAMIPAKEPMPMINVNLIFEFRDNEKDEFELMQFMCFFAIKSIIGKRLFAKTNRSHLLARVFGFTSVEVVNSQTRRLDLFKKYSTRYHMDRVFKLLELNWHVRTYGRNMRGFYVMVGGDKNQFVNMIKAAELKRIKHREKKLKKEKNDLRNIALSQISSY